jgi:hypothetical protein
VFNNGFHLPELGAVGVGLVAEEYVDLGLSVLVFEVVVEVALDGGEEFEPALGCLLYFLFMGEAAAVLDGDEVAHLFVELRVYS